MMIYVLFGGMTLTTRIIKACLLLAAQFHGLMVCGQFQSEAMQKAVKSRPTGAKAARPGGA
jgi:Na+(H+)/acetate symporter ActP